MAIHAQLELFADRPPTPSATNSGAARRLVPEHLSDAALIAALPEASLADACALAAEAGRRRLGDAVRALVALCNRFVGFGVDCRVPEQVAALEALCIIGGPEASRSVSQMIAKGIVQGPNLAVAVIAASRLGVKLDPVVALPLLRHAEPSVRAAACACARPGGDIVATLIDLLADLNGEAATAAACALGIMGRVEARDLLKRCLIEKPSPRVIEALAGVADEEAIVFLARLGRKRPELANSVLSALDEIDHARATVAASGLKSWFPIPIDVDVAIQWSAIRRPRGLAPSNAPRSTCLNRAPLSVRRRAREIAARFGPRVCVDRGSRWRRSRRFGPRCLHVSTWP